MAHLKGAETWGEEAGKGFSFVLPQLLHPSAVSSWILEWQLPGKGSVPRPELMLSSFSCRSELGMLPLFSDTFRVTHLLHQHGQWCLVKHSWLFIYSTQILRFQYCSLLSAQSNSPRKDQWKHLSPTDSRVSHQGGQQVNGLIHCLILWALITTDSLSSSLALFSKLLCLILRQEKIVYLQNSFH